MKWANRPAQIVRRTYRWSLRQIEISTEIVLSRKIDRFRGKDEKQRNMETDR